ncbi:MAG: plasmid stabilization system protein ParE [Rubritalea sp.]|jgi:plasmid stabilization system protein ParE|tara:strand:+ start:602 stop:895 length:294 start_codon:yes stop_codon:yes gene_type:complete
MRVIRHPELASDIRDVAFHYAEISERIHSAFWLELDQVLAKIERNPRSHHFDSCGFRRAGLRRFPYHLLYAVEDDDIYLVVLRHDRRHPDYGVDRQP